MTHRSAARRTVATIVSVTIALLVIGGAASAVIVPTVNLGTAAKYSVVAGETVTNTLTPPATTLSLGLALSPGSAITGFPPGLIAGPEDIANEDAIQAKVDLTAAYVDAQARPVNFTTPAQLGNLVLIGGVYSASLQGPLLLTGPLTLDAQGDPNTVFIIKTNSTLTTASSSTVNLVNRAQECNVFWQIGSSAELGTNSVFAGNILAQTSITVTTGATIRGRALAIEGSVTLDSNTFTTPTCDLSVPVPPPDDGTTTSTSSTSTTAVGGATTTTAVGGATSTTAEDGAGTPTASTLITSLPFTGSPTGGTLVLSISAFAIGVYLLRRARVVER